MCSGCVDVLFVGCSGPFFQCDSPWWYYLPLSMFLSLSCWWRAALHLLLPWFDFSIIISLLFYVRAQWLGKWLKSRSRCQVKTFDWCSDLLGGTMGLCSDTINHPQFLLQPPHSDKDEDFVFLYFFCHLLTFTTVRRRSAEDMAHGKLCEGFVLQMCIPINKNYWPIKLTSKHHAKYVCNKCWRASLCIINCYCALMAQADLSLCHGTGMYEVPMHTDSS